MIIYFAIQWRNKNDVAENDVNISVQIYFKEQMLVVLLIFLNLPFEPEAHVPEWLTWVNSYKSLIQHFSLSVAMPKIKMGKVA